MESLSGKTPTELLKLANDIKADHEQTKKEIVDATFETERLDLFINGKLEHLMKIEKMYVLIVEELDRE